MVKWFKIPRLLRIGRILKQLKGYARFYRVFLAAALFVWLTHMAGCVWQFITDPCDDEIYNTYLAPTSACGDVFFMYAGAMHAGLSAMLATDFRQLPGDDWMERLDWEQAGSLHLFHLLAGWTGQLTLAWLFGEFCTILSHNDPKGWDFWGRRDRIIAEMGVHHLSEELQEKIRKFYDYIYINNRHGHISLLGDADMSVSLRRKVAAELFSSTVKKLRLFKGVSQTCIHAACEFIHLEIHMPDEIIIEEGEHTISPEHIKMFVVKRGLLSVLKNGEFLHNNDGTDVVIAKGGVVNDSAMLDPFLKFPNTVITKTICEMYSLTYNHFKSLIESFPDFAVSIGKIRKGEGLVHVEDAIAVGAKGTPTLEGVAASIERVDRQIKAVAETLRRLHMRV